MLRKNITIDLDAYLRLTHIKLKHESFSDVIKRMVPASTPLDRPVKIDFDAWISAMAAKPASDEFVEAVEEQIRNRRRGLDPKPDADAT